MTHVRFKSQPAAYRFNNLMDDFFTPFSSLYRDDHRTGNMRRPIPVNIKETAQGYQLDLVAPGFAKEDFKIDLDNNLLSISVEKKAENEDSTQDRLIRREYKFESFKRSFTLEESIDAEAISAQYVNGVLTLNLPKKAEVKPQIKQIAIQ